MLLQILHSKFDTDGQETPTTQSIFAILQIAAATAKNELDAAN